MLRDGDPTRPVLLDFGLTFNADSEPEGLNTPGHRAIGSKFLRLPEFDMQGPARLSPVVDVTCTVGILLFLLTSEIPRIVRDDGGQMPHRRPATRAKLEIQTSSDLSILDSIFDVGFYHEPYGRWQSCEVLRDEVRRLQAGTSASPLSFSQKIRARRHLIAEHPDRKIESQKKSVREACPEIADRVHQDFFSAMDVDIIPSSASRYPDDRFFSVHLIDAASPERRLLLEIHRSFESNEFTIFATVTQKEVGGSISKIRSDSIRINLFDPNAKDRISAAIQDAFMFAWSNLGIPGA